MVGSDAAPAALPRKQGLGTSRDPPVRHYDRSAGSRLDWDWRKAANSVQRLVPGSADLGPEGGSQGRPENAAMERRPARASPYEARCLHRQLSTTLRRPALRPLRHEPEGEVGRRRPRVAKNRGCGAMRGT